MLILSTWWDTVTQWSGWGWPGWVAIASVVTVATLAVLVWQTINLRRQLNLEVQARKTDERERRVELQRAHTPYLSIVGVGANFDNGTLKVLGTLHADGDGIVHNVSMSLWRPTGGAPQILANYPPIYYMHADSKHDFLVEVPPGALPKLPLDITVTVTYRNQFEQQVEFTQGARISDGTFKTLSAPQYKWPWEAEPKA